MIHRAGLVLVVLSLLVAGPVERAAADGGPSGAKSFLGEEPPTLNDPTAKHSVRMNSRIGGNLEPGESSSSMETPGGYSMDLKDHLGKVVLICFFDDSPESARELRNVGRVYERYRDHERDVLIAGKDKRLDFSRDRLVLFCITDDLWGSDGPEDRLGDFTHESSKAALQVSISPGVVKSYEVTSYPQKYLVGRDGKVVLEGKFTMDAVSQLVEEDEKAGAEPPKAEYSGRFDAALKAARDGDFSKAAAEAAKLEKAAGADGKNAKALLRWIDERGARRVADGDAAKDAGDVFFARDCYATVEKRWPSKSACVKDARTKAAALKSDPDLKAVFAVEKTWNDAVAAEKAKDAKKAADLFRKCARAAPWLPFADRCAERIDALDVK